MKRKIIVLFLFALILLLSFSLYLDFNSNLVKSERYIEENNNDDFVSKEVKEILIDFNKSLSVNVIFNNNDCGLLQAKEKRQELFRKKQIT